MLVFFVRRRPEIPFTWMFWMFGAFIVSCGFTHFMEVVTFSVPVYRLSGLVKLITAAVSWATVVGLFFVLPRALGLRSPEELEGEIVERKRAEDDLKLKNEMLRLLGQVATAANEAASIDEAMQTCLDCICTQIGWPVGHAYFLAENGSGELVPSSLWHTAELNRFQTFRSATEQFRFGPGLGLPGRVLSSKKPAWITDVTRQAEFTRATHAREAGLYSAFAFPVLVGKEVAAVLEFFSTQAIQPDPPLLEVMSQIGTQLGRVIERERAEHAHQIGRNMLAQQAVELMHSEESYRDQSKILRSILDSISDGVVVANERGKFILFNRAAEQILGSDSADHVTDTWAKRSGLFQLDKTTTYPISRLPLVRAVSGETVTGEEIYVRHSRIPEGKWVSACASPLQGDDGDIRGGVGVFRDITQQKEAEEAQHQARLELERRVRERTDDLAKANKAIQKEILAHHSAKQEILTLNRELENRVQERTAQLESTNHELQNEIEIRKQAEAALRTGEELSRSIIETANDAFVAIDAHSKIIDWNQKAEELFGWKRDETLGRPMAELIIPPSYREGHYQGLSHFMDTGEGSVLRKRVELPALHRRGHTFPVEITIWPLPSGRSYRFNAFVHDITERKHAEEQLRLLAGRLEHSNRELESFASVASHDLQEPLRKIQAFSDRLLSKYRDQLDEPGRDYLDRIQNASTRMRTLIDDLLTFSRVTTKAKPFLSVNLNQVAREVVADLEARIQESGGQVILGTLPIIEADPTQMRQLLQNLIGNGLKFHRPGVPPVIRVECQPATQNGHGTSSSCELRVSDNGIGFEEKYTGRLFQVFSRLHGRSEYEGTGMGLAICRKIVERHGGSIEAKSTPGEGAAFIVRLPVCPSPAQETSSHDRAT